MVAKLDKKCRDHGSCADVDLIWLGWVHQVPGVPYQGGMRLMIITPCYLRIPVEIWQRGKRKQKLKRDVA